MLSVCIPVYNFHVQEIVSTLLKQIASVTEPVEILLLDDGSKDSFKELNRPLSALDHVIYEEMPQNIGRSAIRNELTARAKYEFLLFLDCDSTIENDEFLMNYLKFCEGDITIYGGREYGPQPEDRSFFLQWFYSVAKNGAPYDVRRQRQYHSFCTNNFVIAKRIVEELPFNDSLLTGWGHEDTLFAYSLKEEGYSIQHINNPIMHSGYVSNESFIAQMNQGLVNLYHIYQSGKFNSLVIDFKTTRYLRHLERLRMVGIIAWKYSIFEKFIMRNIRGNKPSLLLFDIYKLGYLCRIFISERRKQKQ
jgi:glycosyltransferase involved in cell wall biosynthesis